MGNPTIFNGRRTKALTVDGLLLQSKAKLDYDGLINYIDNGHGEVNTIGWAQYSDSGAATFTNGSANIVIPGAIVATVGAPISFITGGTLPTNFSPTTTYYIASFVAGTVTVSATQGGTAIVAGSAGSGSHVIRFHNPVNYLLGTNGVSFTRSTTNALRGTANFVYSAGSNVAGSGVSYPFTINVADKAKALTVSFDYLLASGTMAVGAASDVAVWLYDVTNATAIQPSNNRLGSNSTAVADKFSAQFQTAANSVSYVLFLHVSNPTNSAFTLQVDNFLVGPTKYNAISPISAWQNIVPVFSGLGAVTSPNFEFRRNGENLEFRGTGITGSIPGATLGSVTLPNNLQVNTAVVTTGNTTAQPGPIAGYGSVNGGATQSFNLVTATGTSTSQIYFANPINNAASLVPATSTSVASSTQTFSLNFSVPVTGYGVSVPASDITDMRAIALSVSGSPASVVAASAIVFPTVGKDTNNAYNAGTGQFKAPVAGYYFVSSSLFGNVSGNGSLSAYVNGVQWPVAMGGVISATNFGFGSVEVYANAGDLIDVRSSVGISSLTAGTGMTITRSPGTSVVSATESVSARYYSSSTSVSSSLSTIMYSTRSWDSHLAYNPATGIYTCIAPGRYQVNASIAMTGTFILNSTLDLQVQQTGSVTQTSESKSFSGGAVTQMNTNVGDIFYLQVWDQLKVQASNTGGTPIIAATTTQNWFSLARIGNL